MNETRRLEVCALQWRLSGDVYVKGFGLIKVVCWCVDHSLDTAMDHCRTVEVEDGRGREEGLEWSSPVISPVDYNSCRGKRNTRWLEDEYVLSKCSHLVADDGRLQNNPVCISRHIFPNDSLS